jgi:protein-tyrosine phosphatase
MQTRIIQISEEQDVARAVKPAADALRAGGLVAFPTETVYGVGAVATQAKAFEALRELKQRPAAPFSLHLAEAAEVERYVRDIPQAARRLMAKAWPGPVTILLPTGGKLADEKLDKAVYDRLAPEGMIGLRCPDHPVCRQLLLQVGEPVVASSANLAGKRPPLDADGVLKQLKDRIDVLVDAGPTRYSEASTIVSFDKGQLKIIRPGVYDERMIRRMTARLLLFVCSGNTCRSPMAAALAAKLLAEELHCRVKNLPEHGIEIVSAGTLGLEGMPATLEAVEAAAGLGGEVGTHRSRKLTSELIQAADMVFCMSRSHVAEVKRMVSSASSKTHLLDESGDISDPIGAGPDAYVQVAGRIESCLRKKMKEDLL